jgi:hypothetical protein
MVKIDKAGTSFLFIVKIKKYSCNIINMRTKNQYNIRNNLPLEILSSFQEQIQQGIPTILPKQNRMKMLSIIRKKRNPFGWTKLASKKCFCYFQAQTSRRINSRVSSELENLRSHLHVPLSARLAKCAPD